MKSGWVILVSPLSVIIPRANPGFHVSGGRAKGCENVWGISCEKSRFYAKKIIFFQILGEGGGGAPGAPP